MTKEQELLNLKAEKQALEEKLKLSSEENVKLMQESAKHLADSMELGKLQKVQRVLDYIVQDKKVEAIQEILTPLPVLFQIDVRFADDHTALKAKDEMLSSLVDKLKEVLDTAKVQRTDEQKEDEVSRKLDRK